MFTLKSCAVILLLLCTQICYSQDYIITWENDTIPCRLSADPARDELRPASRHKNGYYSIAASFPGDSIRIYKPGEIRGYYRAAHGKSLLCDGVFHSVKGFVSLQTFTNADGSRDGYNWYFMREEEKGKHASLYKVLYLGRGINTTYYVSHHGENKGHPEGIAVWSKRRMSRLLQTEAKQEELNQFIRQTKSFAAMVREYNRLKEAAPSNP